MSRKRVLIHAITWSTLLVFVVIVGSSSLVNGEPVSEVRSSGGNPHYVQSRPVYQKSVPQKPKLVLAKQLQLHTATSGANKDKDGNPNLVTQTVYGFLDFTTTVGNTVMVFTPQTKKVELIQPSSSTIEITPTRISPEPEESSHDDESDEDEEEAAEASSSTVRQPKLLAMDTEEEETVLESSEADVLPQHTTSAYASGKASSSSLIVATPVSPVTSKDGEYVNLVTDATTTTTKRTTAAAGKKSNGATTSSPVEIRTQVNVVSSDDKVPTTTPKGFTLKLSNKSSSSSSSSSYSNGTLSGAEDKKVAFKKDKVLETLILGSASRPFVPASSTKVFAQKYAQITASKVAPSTSTSASASASAASTATTAPVEFRTEQSVVSSSDNQEQDDSEEQLNEDFEPEEDEEFAEQDDADGAAEGENTSAIAPTPTVLTPAAEQTHYVLPQNVQRQEKTAQIYPSSSVAPDSYSRQPQLYVDIVSPAKSFDYIVTATPTSASSGRKQFRQQQPAPSGGGGTRNEYLNRFSNRFSRKPPSAGSTESNELTTASNPQNSYEQLTEQDNGGPTTFQSTRSRATGANRFRSRNNRKGQGQGQGQDNIEPTTAVSLIYSNIVTATPSSTRRYNSNGGGRSRNNGKNYQEYGGGAEKSPVVTASRGGYSPSRQKVTISPTTSSSIYRFKLNRPTGRWRFKPSPKPKVSIIKSKEDEPAASVVHADDEPSQNHQFQQRELLQQQSNGPVYPQQYGVPADGNENYQYAPSGGSGVQYEDDPHTDSNELAQDEVAAAAAAAIIPDHLLPQTLRVATITPTEFSDLDKYLEIATIKSPYVFQAGNVKNTRYITVTKTFTKEVIRPTQALEVHETLENILATRAPYEKILEGSNDVATLPVIILGEDMATPPLETVTQTFSTTQLMLKTSILPAVYDGVTTLYTLTQSYFVTRLVTAHKTVPPMELFQFVPTKSLREFNTALQEAESEHREQLLGSELEDENDSHYQQIVAAPDELKFVGSDFDPSFMDEQIPQSPKSAKSSSSNISPKKTSNNGGIPDLSNLTPEQLAFFRFLTANHQQQQQQQQQQIQIQQQQPQQNPFSNYFQSPPLAQQQAPQFLLASSPVVIDTVTTIVETKTLRILFGAKPTQTTLYSTRVVPTKVTTYITAASAQPQIPNFFQPGAYPFGAFVG